MKAGDVGRQHHIMKLLIMKWSDCAVKKKKQGIRAQWKESKPV